METNQADSTEALFARYVIPNYGRFPVAMVRGDGCRIWDESGKEYLDFGGGVAVCSLGHCHPAMTRALREQAESLIHCSNLYLIRDQALLARRLSEEAVGAPGKVFFCNSGAEANDALIKLARKFGHAMPRSGGAGAGARFEVITFDRSFHGRTLGGIAATAQPKVKEGFDPMLPGFRHLPFNDADALRAGISPQTAALLLEVVQGEGGINVATPEFLRAAAEVCREHDLLLMLDEVQCGLGRTGDLCGWKTVLGEAAGDAFAPDAVSWAKGAAGGYPLGAIWVRDRAVGSGADSRALCDILGPGTHGATFGGSPLACAAGSAVIGEILKSRLWENAREQGEFLRREIEHWDSNRIESVRGLGLMLGIVLHRDAFETVPGFTEAGVTPAKFMVEALMEMGLLTVPAGDTVVRLLPPLNITRKEAQEALEILRAGFNVP